MGHIGPGLGRLPIARSDDLVISELGDELLIFDLRTNTGLCLNAEAARVWRALDGSRTLDQLTADVGLASTDLAVYAIKRLAVADLLVGDVPESVNDAVMPRRELMRKLLVAGAGAVALPVVATFAVPTSAAAASNACTGVLLTTCVPGGVNPTGCPCTGTPQCVSGNVCPIAPGTSSGFCTSINGTPALPICVPGNVTGLSDTCCPCIGTPTCAPGNVCPIAPGTSSGICTSIA